MKAVDVADASQPTVGKRPYTRKRFPMPGSTLSGWLAKVVTGRTYSTNDIAEIVGSSASAIRTVFHRQSVPKDAQPTGPGDRSWTYPRARAFLRWLAQYAQLPDAFDEPMMTAEQAATRLGVNYHKFMRGTRIGHYPEPAYPSRGTVGALWSAAEIEELAAAEAESDGEADEAS